MFSFDVTSPETDGAVVDGQIRDVQDDDVGAAFARHEDLHGSVKAG